MIQDSCLHRRTHQVVRQVVVGAIRMEVFGGGKLGKCAVVDRVGRSNVGEVVDHDVDHEILE